MTLTAAPVDTAQLRASGMLAFALAHMRQAYAQQAMDSPEAAQALSIAAGRLEEALHVPAVDTAVVVESLIEVAQRHGEDSDPDHEVGDLQDFLRATWEVLAPGQRAALLCSAEISSVVEGATGEGLATHTDEATDWTRVMKRLGLDPSKPYDGKTVLEHTNMHRLKRLAAGEEADAVPRYVHGAWDHIFQEGRPAVPVRFVYDRQGGELVALECQINQGWSSASEAEMGDVEDSLKNGNEDAIDDPDSYGLEEGDVLPDWAASENARAVERARG
ncbi:hypothetical protein [Ramlibacter sp. AN1133]|uniref:hypothetical protein n=1 Tax=Ramlibacter sp. AN1133 TaxID=3133429 RepID=UPI0030BD7F72